MQKYDVYNDIKLRTNGEIYIGVVGPVRTGKSTFVKKFMDLMVIPNIDDKFEIERTLDEMPQSGAGKTITTTEPKFIPANAVDVNINADTNVSVRIVDSVGFMVDGAVGHMESDVERMVKTPWYEYEIPFTKAAEIGTKKVITDHSTIGIVVTCDGSFSEIPRESYVQAEKRTIDELMNMSKPFVVLLNSSKPLSEETKELADKLSNEYNTAVIPINIAAMKNQDIVNIFQAILMEFCVTQVNFIIPKWIEILGKEHQLKDEIIRCAKSTIKKLHCMKDINELECGGEFAHVNELKVIRKDMSTGLVEIGINVDEKYYYETISMLSGSVISNEYELIGTLKEFKDMKESYLKVKDAMDLVEMKGYGVVIPNREEIELETPTVIKNGNKYGIKIEAKAPSIHMIKADVLTEIAPIVGSEEQANDLIKFIDENKNDTYGIWETNIFGKTIEQIVYDGISTKISKLNDETRNKMQDTIGKITNDSKGGVICIII